MHTQLTHTHMHTPICTHARMHTHEYLTHTLTQAVHPFPYRSNLLWSSPIPLLNTIQAPPPPSIFQVLHHFKAIGEIYHDTKLKCIGGTRKKIRGLKHGPFINLQVPLRPVLPIKTCLMLTCITLLSFIHCSSFWYQNTAFCKSFLMICFIRSFSKV